jgi:hypothetical protein
MNEAQWLACDDLRELLNHLAGGDAPTWEVLFDTLGIRKLVLFGVAYCRRLWRRVTDRATRTLVDRAEQFVDGRATEEELAEAFSTAWPPTLSAGRHNRLHEQGAASVQSLLIACTGFWEDGEVPQTDQGYDEGYEEVIRGLEGLQRYALKQPRWSSMRKQSARQVVLLRDIVGNPFRRPKCRRPWLTWNDGTVVRLARTMYEKRRFGELPVLADALEDAGCDNAELLGHLRGPGPHVRGCWVVDLILAKE